MGSNYFSITLLYDKKKEKCVKNESLPLLPQLHHLPFTSQPTAIWLPSHLLHSDCSNEDVNSVFLLAESNDLFLGPLLLDLPAALDRLWDPSF